MPAKKRTTITVPPLLAAELKHERARLQTAVERGQRIVPDEYVEEIPLHYVIAELLRFKQAHLERSRRRGSQAAVTAK